MTTDFFYAAMLTCKHTCYRGCAVRLVTTPRTKVSTSIAGRKNHNAGRNMPGTELFWGAERKKGNKRCTGDGIFLFRYPEAQRTTFWKARDFENRK